MPPLTDDSLEGKLKLGAILMITMRWAVRLMGLVSMVILARLLTPEDFGIVAMAMVFQALMEGLVNLNVELAIIRNQQAEKAHYDSAWTLGLVQFAVIGAILASLAGYAAEFYDEPRLEAVIWVAALALFVRGWVNIGVVDFRKDLNFPSRLEVTTSRSTPCAWSAPSGWPFYCVLIGPWFSVFSLDRSPPLSSATL